MSSKNVKWCDVIEHRGKLYYFVGVQVGPSDRDQLVYTAPVGDDDRWDNVRPEDFDITDWDQVSDLDADRTYSEGVYVGEFDTTGPINKRFGASYVHLDVPAVARFMGDS